MKVSEFQTTDNNNHGAIGGQNGRLTANPEVKNGLWVKAVANLCYQAQD